MQKHVSPSPPLPLSSLFLSPQPLKAPLEARRYIRSPGDLVSKESACNAGDLGVIPGLGRSPGGGHSNHPIILAWKIPMDRGVW